MILSHHSNLVLFWDIPFHNIVLAREIVHSMARMTCKKGFISIKIDLEKAYDRQNLEFCRKLSGWL